MLGFACALLLSSLCSLSVESNPRGFSHEHQKLKKPPQMERLF
jgi:hypothetical protein